jgi:4-hydroxythreonine-4-phosphate dehydrogenase
MLPLVLTMGEPAGIGGEIALAAWSRRAAGVPRFVLIDDPGRLATLARRLRLDVPVRAVDTPEAAGEVWPDALPVLPIALSAPVVPGRPDLRNSGAVIHAIRVAAELVLSGQASGMVTNPIQKHVLIEAGFKYPGHTEFLAELAGPGARPVMMLACPGLRVVPVTVHLALKDAIASLTTERIVAAARIAHAALQREFSIKRPRLAVAGLNPHAGEGGLFGREESLVIEPALEILRAEGLRVTGPLAPDSMFHVTARAGYDAALCMYHDQALIPLKTIDFERGVNITLGLPFVRTSPDHGTALGIAGRGKASAESLIAALTTAQQMAAARQEERAGPRG